MQMLWTTKKLMSMISAGPGERSRALRPFSSRYSLDGDFSYSHSYCITLFNLFSYFASRLQCVSNFIPSKNKVNKEQKDIQIRHVFLCEWVFTEVIKKLVKFSSFCKRKTGQNVNKENTQN